MFDCWRKKHIKILESWASDNYFGRWRHATNDNVTQIVGSCWPVNVFSNNKTTSSNVSTHYIFVAMLRKLSRVPSSAITCLSAGVICRGSRFRWRSSRWHSCSCSRRCTDISAAVVVAAEAVDVLLLLPPTACRPASLYYKNLICNILSCATSSWVSYCPLNSNLPDLFFFFPQHGIG